MLQLHLEAVSFCDKVNVWKIVICYIQLISFLFMCQFCVSGRCQCRGNEHCNKDCLHTHTFNAHSNVEPWLVKWYFNSQFKESKHIIWVRKSVGKINNGYENTPQSVVPQCSDLFKICWFILCQIWCFNEEKKVPDWVFGSSNIIDWLIFLWFLLFMRIIAVCCKNVLTYYVKL